ncbi:MAG: hypothetical protein ACU85V_15470 [Gammaproteobacteria bacterium]
MITYLYWGIVVATVIGAMTLFAGRMNNIRLALAASAVILLAGWSAYYFHFQQIFVKRFGGVMSISVPDGQRHIAATWKDDNLWVENYDPATDTCIFSEYSRGNVLQGQVKIKRCKPYLHGQPAAQSAQAPAATPP